MSIIIGISGGSGSGKTTAAHELCDQINLKDKGSCSILFQDSYYIDQSQYFKGDGSVNFDHPDAIDFALMKEHLIKLKQKKMVQVPIYDFVTHTRKDEKIPFAPTKVVILDGTLIFTQKPLVDLLFTSVFLKIPEELRFKRRLYRDVNERGRTSEGVTLQFNTNVKPMHDLYVEPSSIHAKFVVTHNHGVHDVVQNIIDMLIKDGIIAH